MATYVTLISWTPEGAKGFRESVDRYERAKAAFEAIGGSLSILYTLGAYDAVSIAEAPDDETATAMLLQLGSLGFVRTQTMRAFGPEEMRGIIAKAG